MTGKAFNAKSSISKDVSTTGEIKSTQVGDEYSFLGKIADKVRRDPGIPEFLMALRIVAPLIRKKMENPSFNPKTYLDKAIISAHEIANTSLVGAPVNRYLIGNITNAVIGSGLIENDDVPMMVSAVEHIFNGKKDEISFLVSQLSDAVRVGDGVAEDDLEIVLKSALLSHSAEVLADIKQFSFWTDRDSVSKSIINLIGDLSAKLAMEKMDRSLTERQQVSLVHSIVARVSSIACESYRLIAYADMDKSRAESTPAQKAAVRAISTETYLSRVAEMTEIETRRAIDMAMGFCLSNIAPKSGLDGVKI